MKIFTSIIIAIGFIHLLAAATFALDQYPGDTAIYGVSTAAVQPNVLIILDNSGSMNGEVLVGDPYDPSTIYTATDDCSDATCVKNTVYRWRSWSQTWQSYIGNVNSIGCSTAKDALTTDGTYQGRLRTNGNCGGSRRSFATGNYVNWVAQSGGYRDKIVIAKEVLIDLINTTSGVNFGLMIFNYEDGGHIAGVGDGYGDNGYEAYIKDMDAIHQGTTTNKYSLVKTIENINADTWTPLAETLWEAMKCYQGEQTQFNGSYTYTTPIEYNCQQNYIILLSDGMSTRDRESILTSICSSGDCDGDGYEPANDSSKSYSSDGSDYVDDVAKYINDTDLLTDSAGDEWTTGKQNVVTFTIGFGLSGVPSAEQLLQETAFNGGGQYYSASSTQGLSESLRRIIATIIEDNTSFVAPVLPLSPENRTFSGSRVYMGFFKPGVNAFWNGNLKKYGLDDAGIIVDKNDNPATNSDGSIKSTAISYWSAFEDGSEVDQGGVGGLLMTRSTDRDIYTHTGTTTDLTDSTNAFETTNGAITSTLLDLQNNPEKDKLINFIHGIDTYDDDANGNTTEKRDWILGDILHSKPLAVHYATYTLSQESNCTYNKSIIFVGANDGMLHAFKDCDGSELWAFIPPDLLPYLKHLAESVHTYYVDFSPTTYIYDADSDGNIETVDGDKVIIIFGERRGGDFYYALDISDPSSPQYLWRLSDTESPSGTNTDYSELGESWSEPVVATVKVDVSGTETTKVVAFVGAGYDNVNEDLDDDGTNTMGRGVYAIEVATLDSNGVPSFSTSGYKVWGYTYADDSSLTDSIPSQLSVIDIDSDGYTDRIYVGDTDANIWRFDTTDTDTANWTGRMIFESDTGSDNRKIFYRPSVTLEIGYEMLFFGTGDRAHPLAEDEVDRLYGVKDTDQSSAKDENDLSDATSGTVDVTGTDGWYIELPNSGEKDLARASVINKIAYFTTYEPSSVVSGDPCEAGARGTARLYAVEYLTATAAYNYDTSNDSGGWVVLETSDRSTLIGTGIPSGVVVVISPSGISALIGVGGAIVTPEVSDTGSVIPVYWREVR